jgi:hypothetical protein
LGLAVVVVNIFESSEKLILSDRLKQELLSRIDGIQRVLNGLSIDWMFTAKVLEVSPVSFQHGFEMFDPLAIVQGVKRPAKKAPCQASAVSLNLKTKYLGRHR